MTWPTLSWMNSVWPLTLRTPECGLTLLCVETVQVSELITETPDDLMISCDDCVLVTCEIFPPGLILARCMSESGLVHAQIYDLHILGPLSAVWLVWLASYCPDCLQRGPCSAAVSQSGRCIPNCRPITGRGSPADARPQTLQQPGTKQTARQGELTI